MAARQQGGPPAGARPAPGSGWSAKRAVRNRCAAAIAYPLGPMVLGDYFNQDRLQRRCRYIRDMARADLAAAFYERHNRFVARQSFRIRAVFRLAADMGFVRFCEPTFAAKRIIICRPHCLADAMRHDPRRFVGNAKRAVPLVRRNVLFA